MVVDLADDVLLVLTRDAQGRENAIGVDKLYEAVFGVPPRDKINSTRVIRGAITALRRRGVPVCSCSLGYYLAETAEELEEACAFLRRRALHSLVLEARIRKVNLEELLGQLRLKLEEEMAEDERQKTGDRNLGRPSPVTG